MNPTDAQFEGDKKVIEQLKKHGDNCAAIRDVDHYAYFPTHEKATQFVDWLAANGYSVSDDEPHACEESFGVSFVVQSRADLESISAHTFRFSEKAFELGGEYDGWGCEVQRDTPPKKGFLRRFLGLG